MSICHSQWVADENIVDRSGRRVPRCSEHFELMYWSGHSWECAVKRRERQRGYVRSLTGRIAQRVSKREWRRRSLGWYDEGGMASPEETREFNAGLH